MSKTVSGIRNLDLLERVEFYDVSAEWQKIKLRFPGLNQEACFEEMHVATPRGEVFTGFDGYRQLAWALPLTWPAVPFLYLPGMPSIGRHVYRAVASQRHRHACPLPLEKFKTKAR